MRLLQSSSATLASRGTESFGSRNSGFTLIELVVSAALMSMILGSAYLCLRSGIASQKLIDTRAEIFQNARVAMALISSDLRCARTLSKDFEFVGIHRTLGEVDADNLDFATSYSPRRPAEGDFCETSYFLQKDPESGQFQLWRRRDSTPDDLPLEGGEREEIARGLTGLRFEYYDGFEWFDDWGDPDGRRKRENSFLEHPNLFGMPEAVRITLWFDSNPRSVRKDSEQKEKKEPPLVYQTIARLNLATVSQSSGSSSSSSSSGNRQQQISGGGPR
jgi:prepilin-type N-terminal cleavage/methylation domain-containing protein